MTSAARKSIDPRAGFSLLELVVALSIASLLIGGAVTYLVFRTDERELRNTAGEIELLAKQARTSAILHQAPYALEFRPGLVRLTPLAAAGMMELGSLSLSEALGGGPVHVGGEVPTGGGGKSVQLKGDMAMFVKRWNYPGWLAMSDKLTHVWRFDPDGLCEPLGVRLEIGGNHMEVTFHPLTATVTDTVLHVE